MFFNSQTTNEQIILLDIGWLARQRPWIDGNSINTSDSNHRQIWGRPEGQRVEQGGFSCTAWPQNCQELSRICDTMDYKKIHGTNKYNIRPIIIPFFKMCFFWSLSMRSFLRKLKILGLRVCFSDGKAFISLQEYVILSSWGMVLEASSTPLP